VVGIKVVFCKEENIINVAGNLGDCYILSSDNWDDYGYKTYFKVSIYKDNEAYGKFGRKILFEQQDEIGSSSGFLETKISNNLYVDLEDIKEEYNFISLGYEYEELKKIFPDTFENFLNILNDVIYLERRKPNSHLLELKNHKGFEESLCRDQSARKVLDEGQSSVYGDEIDSDRFKFKFKFHLEKREYEYDFNFIKNELPHRINILVGKNGSGKSQTLLALSKYLTNRTKAINEFNIEVDNEPNFLENLMVFAYNPYEEFPIFNYYTNSYKYLGFRRYQKDEDIRIKDFFDLDNGLEIIKCINENYSLKNVSFSSHSDADIIIRDVMNHCYDFTYKNIADVCMHINSEKNKVIFDNNNPLKETYNSFKSIYNRDRDNYAHEIKLSDIPYRNKIIEFLSNAFSCDAIALKFISDNKDFYSKQKFDIIDNYLILGIEAIHQNFVKDIGFDDFEEKLYFFNQNNRIFLSSGQQTFADLVINLLSLIKKNSLILIDEPENTLHPNLEIDFIKILKDILEDFDSFAVIATHSSIIVREVPTEYVQVIKIDTDNQPVIMPPTIKTFGADIRKITNYVFDDVFIKEKPFEIWLREESKKYNSFYEFEEKYKNILNYNILLNAKSKWFKND